MRKSIFVAMALIIIIIGIGWWAVNKGGWNIKEFKFGTDAAKETTDSGKPEDSRDLLSSLTGKKDEPDPAEGAFIKRGLAVKVFKVSRGTFEDLLPAMGSIKGLVTRKLNFEIPGLVEKLNVRENDLARQGTVLASLKKNEAELKVEFNRAKMKAAMTAASQAEKKLTLFRSLFELGGINQLKLSEVESEAATAKHQLEAAQIEVESAQAELKKTEIIAPTDCIVTEVEIEEGEAISSSVQKAIEVAEIDVVFAEVGIVERDVTKIRVGQLARVYVDAYIEFTFDGIIHVVYPKFSEKTRTLPVEIKIDNSRRLLLPGMFARAEVILYEKPGVVSVPRMAIKKQEEQSMVYVIDEKTNSAMERLVELGYESTDYIEIKRGLEEGDMVAITNVEGLTSGTPVQITEIQIREM